MSTQTTRSYLVKVVAGKTDTTRVWNSRKPMTVGHGLRWVIEQKDDGISVRSLESKEDLPKKAVEELFLKHSEIEKSASVCLSPGARPSEDFRIELRPVASLEPAFADQAKVGSSLRVFYCKKDWAIESFTLTDSFTARTDKKKVFKLKGNINGIYAPTDSVEVQALIDGVTIVSKKGSESIAKGEKRQISFGIIAESTIAYEGSTWRFAQFQKSEVSDILAGPLAADAEDQLVQKILKGAAVATLLLGLVTWLLPSTPPQVAEQKIHIVLKKRVAGMMTAAPKGDRDAKDLSIGKSGSSKNAGRKGTPNVAQSKKIAPAGHENKHAMKVAQQPKAHKSEHKVAHHSAPAKSAPKKTTVAHSSPKKSATKAKTVVASAKPSKQKKSAAHTQAVAAALPKSELFKTLSSASFRSTAKGLAAGGSVGGHSSDSYAEARAMGSSGGGTGGGSLGGADGVSTRSAAVTGFGGGAGNGDGGPGSAGAGYGRGSYSKVSGQGRSFVSLDTGASDVDEGLTREQVGRVINSHFQEIRYCYEAAKLRSPDVEGEMALKFSVGGTGDVRTAGVGNSTVSNSRLHDCLVSHLKTWKFPHPRGGVTVAVAYPLYFKSLTR